MPEGAFQLADSRLIDAELQTTGIIYDDEHLGNGLKTTTAELIGLPNSLITGVARGATNAAVATALDRLDLPATMQTALADLIEGAIFSDN